MRIAMMTDSWYPTRDGVVTSITIIRESLEALGHEVVIIAPEPEPEARQEGVYYFPAVRFKSYPGYYLPILPSDKMEILREIDPDIIHIHGVATMALRGLICGHELGIPTVMTFHTMVDDAAKYYSPVKLPPETMERLIWIYLRQILKRMDVVVTPTACIGSEIEARGAVCRNLMTVPTGTDTGHFHPGIPADAVRERHGLAGKRVAIHVGRISYEKELDMVIRAMQRVDAVLLVAGRGPAKDDIEKLVDELGLRDKVVFAGFVPDEELPMYYNAADIAVSASKFETQGLSILEAMASGRPVACRNGRAFAEIIHDGENGYLFDDVDGCAEAMEKAFSARAELREASLATALANSRDRSAELYVQAYELARETKAARSSR
ncbi:MAG: glycosyltransferase [Thermoplasmata archaeon]|nr:glycosyltransferase [Thermoplasmata archaeon]